MLIKIKREGRQRPEIRKAFQDTFQSSIRQRSSGKLVVGAQDVIQAVTMIRRVPALLRVDELGSRTLVPVRSVLSQWVGYEADLPENHRNRYDVLLNGAALDLDHFYIEYDGAMTNLRALFTYRNQTPPGPVFRLE